MEEKYLNSSAIKKVTYSEDTKRMVITFTGGNTYPYCGVPIEVYQQLISAKSAGTYFNAHIRDRYQC